MQSGIEFTGTEGWGMKPLPCTKGNGIIIIQNYTAWSEVQTIGVRAQFKVTTNDSCISKIQITDEDGSLLDEQLAIPEDTPKI